MFRRHSLSLLFVGCLLGVVGWLFAGALFRGELFVFRDAAHFYYPLLTFTAQEWLSGRVPLWNPYEQLGMPLAATGTSAAFYPGIVLLLIGLPPAWGYKLYIVGHLLAAAGSCWWVARRLGISTTGASLAALSYALGGTVLFQYCNVVYLVGAVWLPWSLLFSIRLAERYRPAYAIALGVVWGLMILGGDPQLAYHSGLLAVGLLLARWWNRRKATPPHEADTTSSQHFATNGKLLHGKLMHGGGLLLLAGCVTIGIAAIQLVPAMELSSRTERAVRAQPRTIWELATDLTAGQPRASSGPEFGTDALRAHPEEMGPHGAKVYDFSFAPWRLCELFWPGIGGRLFPTHQWLWGLIPAEGRIWTPSIYLGLLPIFLGLSAFGGRLSWPWQPLKWLLVLALLASFGRYGLGFLLREIVFACGGNPANVPVGNAFGGLYWLMVTVLPSYVYFRYPAKLLVLAALAVALLAGWRWDQLDRRSAQRLTKAFILGGTLSGLLWFVTAWLPWNAWLAGAEKQPLFGPLDVTAAVAQLRGGLLQATLLAGAFAALFLLWLRRPNGSCLAKPGWLAAACILLTTVDLGWAGRWYIPTASETLWNAPSAAGQQILARHSSPPSSPGRMYRGALWLPASWQDVSSVHRQTELVRWDRDTLWPKYNLEYRIPQLRVLGTVTLADYAALLEQATAISEAQLAQRAVQRGTGLDAFATNYYLLPEFATEQVLPEQEDAQDVIRLSELPLRDAADVAVRDAVLLAREAAPPRAWISREIRLIAPVHNSHEPALKDYAREVLGTVAAPRDLIEGPVCLDQPPPAWCVPALGMPAEEDERCEVLTSERPDTLELLVKLNQPGFVVLTEQYYPGWEASWLSDAGSSVEVPLVRANGVMRGMWLPAGEHQVTMHYRPRSFTFGAWLSGFTLLVLLAFASWVIFNAWRGKNAAVHVSVK